MADSTTKTVGVDLSKQVFAICETNPGRQVIRRLELRRDAFCQYPTQLRRGEDYDSEAWPHHPMVQRP